MSNFYNYPSHFEHIVKLAKEAEENFYNNLDITGIYLRKTIETWVQFVYEIEPALEIPKEDNNIYALMQNPDFIELIDDTTLLSLMHTVRKLGNIATHQNNKLKKDQVLHSLNLTHEICYKLINTYHNAYVVTPVFSEANIPQSISTTTTEIQALKAKLQEIEKQKLYLVKKSEQLQQELATNRIENQKQNTPIKDPNEALTREIYIDLLLEEMGWDLSHPNTKEFKVQGMPNKSGEGFADYVLWDTNGKPLAVVEAKRTSREHQSGKHQAELYATCLEKQFGQKPVVYITNGYEISFYDWEYPVRTVQGFHTQDQLQLLIQRRKSKTNLNNATINEEISGRYYQIEAIKAVAQRLEQKHRGALLVMATGTGKTRTSASLIDMLSKANWAKKVLFLADRTALVTQAKNNLNDYLPNLPSVDLRETKEDGGSRIVFSTYQTLINKIDNEHDGVNRFYGIGHFDVIIFDEIHRSIYNKYRAIFNYFDGIKIGLTATPVDFTDKNTYELFGLENGNPTYNYDLDTAVNDGFLVNYQSIKVKTKFQRDGIKYNELSEAEKEEYEEKFGDPITGEFPDEIEATALDNWLYNTETADEILKYVMENGIKVDDESKLGKTIIFAKNNKHSNFLRQRFDILYPEYGSQFLKIIDYTVEQRHDLLTDFKSKDKCPQIACSVDMLDTGIDVPEIVNLVFLKPVKSRVKFWQMIGRGTRLCEDLFGHKDHKKEFLIFDFCDNFEFFNQKPLGLEPNNVDSFQQRLFKVRFSLAQLLLSNEDESLQHTGEEILTYTYNQAVTVYQTKKDSFLVRPHLKVLENFQEKSKWYQPNQANTKLIIDHISPLVFEKDKDNEALKFDLIVFDYTVNFLNGIVSDALPSKVMTITNNLKKQTSIPLVKAKIETINKIATEDYWQNISVSALEFVRKEMRDLIKFMTKEQIAIIHTTLKDEIITVEEPVVIYEKQSFNKEAYQKKLEQYIIANKNNLIIDRIHKNIKVTSDQINELEKMLFEQGSAGTKDLFIKAFGDQPLGEFIRSVIGLDETTVKNEFAKIVNFAEMNSNQITFVNYLITNLIKEGKLEEPERSLFTGNYKNLSSKGIVNLLGKDITDKIIKTINEINNNCVA